MREAEIKTALSDYISNPSSSMTRLILEEVALEGGEVRADLVNATDMHCYEIKSEADSLKRLVTQGARYGEVFEKITLVTADRHLEKALSVLPSWWGVMLVKESGRKKFRHMRKAKKNNGQLSNAMVTLLKKEEAISMLEELGMAKGWKSKSLYQIQEHIAESIPLNDLKFFIKKALMDRATKNN
ncbi:sce7726 family protein [Vreelandella janggokensis]|uniref:sce7726 family protein n=1 Tax=Vreelandella janggokensis TaxID=370767 RepID=UPI0028580E1C|nr:sce7726 family protein [Halomonas janggokensis]MDR5885968.1 sce7726 family protein [Halomonas janggokensis]